MVTGSQAGTVGCVFQLLKAAFIDYCLNNSRIMHFAILVQKHNCRVFLRRQPLSSFVCVQTILSFVRIDIKISVCAVLKTGSLQIQHRIRFVVFGNPPTSFVTPPQITSINPPPAYVSSKQWPWPFFSGPTTTYVINKITQSDDIKMRLLIRNRPLRRAA